MLRITVTRFNGVPPASPLFHEFDERGGSIGREMSNQLVLPDPERLISRLQAQIEFVDNAYRLVDQGGNPSCINGQAVGKGNARVLRDGDELTLGDYTLRVEEVRPAPVFGSAREERPDSRRPTPSNDPLGLFASDREAGARDSGGSQNVPAEKPGSASSPANNDLPPKSDDPFAVFGAPPIASPASRPNRQTAPVDDPFSAFGAPTQAAQPQKAQMNSRRTDPLDLGVGPTAQESSLDGLFGLDASKAPVDPFAGSPLGASPSKSSPLAENVDPLALLSGLPAAETAASARNDSPILRDAFVAPKIIAPESPSDQAKQGSDLLAILDSAPAAASASPTPASAAPPAQGAVSWEGSIPPSTAPAPSAPPPARAKVSVEGMGLAPQEIYRAPASTAAAVSTSGQAEMQAALLRGLGLTELKLADGMTPEFMEHLGVMLREAVQGTVELLIARAAVKREVRAEVTMIVSRNNNPLKFSPDVGFALTQLLAPQSTGFMPPVEAMRDAYDDLRAHQLGFMAGMRAAIAGMLARFKPEDLEKRLADKSFLDSLLPSNRKSKLWDLYEQRFSEISREAEEDFHALFGEEFLKAYEAQIERLQNARES